MTLLLVEDTRLAVGQLFTDPTAPLRGTYGQTLPRAKGLPGCSRSKPRDTGLGHIQS